MKYSLIIEKISDGSLPDDFYYAHIPTLDLTTHGRGVEGATQAAVDLLKLWIEEKIHNKEQIPIETESYFTKIELSDAILSA